MQGIYIRIPGVDGNVKNKARCTGDGMFDKC